MQLFYNKNTFKYNFKNLNTKINIIDNKNFKLTNLKFLLFTISLRRNFIPILSIFFLTLPNTTAHQIWIFTWIWFIATLLFEVPSWYISDIFGHKKTLVLAKISQVLSMICYLLWYYLVSPYNFYIFVVASIFQTIWFAFFSWTKSAFYHDILEEAWKEKEFAKYEWKLWWNVSLASVLMIFLLPFTITFHILSPFLIWWFVDILWIIVLLSIPNPKLNHNISDEIKHKSFIVLFKEAWSSWLLNLSIFLWLISWFLLWESPFRWPYLEELWYPIVFIWAVMWLSRLIWFVLWHTIHKIEKHITMKQHFFIEIFLFSWFFLTISFLNNPYIVWIIISLIIWYRWWRGSLVRSYILKDYIKDQRYKATFFSMSSMLNSIFGVAVTFVLWYFISIHWYKPNYLYLWVILFILLSISYYFTFIRQKK